MDRLRVNAEQSTLLEEQARLVSTIRDLALRVQAGEASVLEVRKLARSHEDWARVYEAVFSAARGSDPLYIDTYCEIEQAIGQEPQMIGLKKLQEIALAYYFDPDVPERVARGIAESFGLHLASFGVSETWFESTLDFSNDADFEKNFKTIDFLTDAYAYAFNINERGAAHLRDYLNRALEKQNGSYLLRAWSKDLIAGMDGDSHLSYENEPLPIEVAPNEFGIAAKDALYVVPTDSIARLQALRTEWSRLHTEVERSLRAHGTAPGGLVYEMRKVSREACALATHRVAAAEVCPEHLSAQDAALLEREYARLMHQSFRRRLQQEIDVELFANKRENYYVLHFLRSAREGDVSALRAHSQVYGREGLRALLATSIDPAAGEEILKLGEWGRKHDKAAVEQVFAKFCELSDRIDTLGDYIRTAFGKDDPEVVRGATREIIKRGRDVIGRAFHAAQEGSLDTVAQDIAKLDAGTRVLTAITKVLHAQGPLELEKIPGVQVDVVRGGEIGDNLAAEMLRIQEWQYGAEGTGYNDEDKYPGLYRALNDTLAKRIRDSASRFFLLKVNGEIAGYFRLDDMEQDGKQVRHLASVMGNPAFAAGKLVEVFLASQLAKAGERSVPITAESNPLMPIHRGYLAMGFEEVSDGEEHGLPIKHLVLPPRQNS